MGTLFKDYLQQRLKDDLEFAREYERLGPRFEAINQLMEARKRLGLSQTELAKRMRVAPHVVSRLESAEHSPRLETLASAARAMGFLLEIRFRQLQGPLPSERQRTLKKYKSKTTLHLAPQ